MGKCITSCGKDKARCCTDDCFLRVTEGSRLRDLKYNNLERFFVPLHIWRIVRSRAATHFSICL